MNKVSPYEYLVNLLEKYKTLTEKEKPALMPCYYKSNLKSSFPIISSRTVTLVFIDN